MKAIGLVKITVLDKDTRETLRETDWQKNAIFDHAFTNSAPGSNTGRNDQNATQNTNTTLDPTSRMYNNEARDRWGGYWIFATDEYRNITDKSIRSFPGNHFVAQIIPGTPPMTLEGGGNVGTTTELKCVQQILPPASGSRSLHTFGISANGPIKKNTNYLSLNIRPMCGISLASPVTQSSTEVVVVSYRIQFPLSTNGLSLDEQMALNKMFVGQPRDYVQLNSLQYLNDWSDSTRYGSAYYNYYFFNSKLVIPAPWSPPKQAGQYPVNITYDPLVPNSGAQELNAFSTVARDGAIFDQRWDGVYYIGASFLTTDTDVGAFVGSYRPASGSVGSSYNITGYTTSWARILPDGQNKTQQYFNKTQTSTVPFFDPVSIPNTDGTVVLDTSSYSVSFPEVWKIDYSGTTGGVGTVEYSFMKRYGLGYLNNTLQNRKVLGWTSNGVYVNTTDNEFGTFQNRYVYENSLGRGSEWDYRRRPSPVITLDGVDPANGILGYNYNHLHLHDLVKQTVILYNESKTPTFTATNLGQVEWDDLSNTLWLSCGDTGIWSIQDPMGTGTITNYDLSGVTDVAVSGSPGVQNKCYAITVGEQSGANNYRVLWAFMEGALVKSTDNGSTWVGYDSTSTGGTTFTNTTVEGAWHSIYTIKADRNNTDRIMFLYDQSPASALNQDGANANEAYVSIVANWWSPANDCTPVLPSNGSIPFFSAGAFNLTTANRGFYFYMNSGSRPRSEFYDTKKDSFLRRQMQKQIGCTKKNSNWYFANYFSPSTNTTMPINGTYYDAPLEVSWEQTLSFSPANYNEFLNGDTHKQATGGNYGGDYMLRNGSNESDGFVGYNRSDGFLGDYFNVFEFTDDDGNDALIKWTTAGDMTTTNGGYEKWTFGTYRCDFLGHPYTFTTEGGTWASADFTNTAYLGRGIIYYNTETAGTSYNYLTCLTDLNSVLGVNNNWAMQGEIWERYKWTGSAWVRRVDDNDPLTFKTTHATTDNLIGGATISFDDDGATQSFTSGEMTFTHVVDGLLIDGGTSGTTASPIFSFWDSELVTEVTNGTIASNTPSELIPISYNTDFVPSNSINQLSVPWGTWTDASPAGPYTEDNTHTVWSFDITSTSYNISSTSNTQYNPIHGFYKMPVPVWRSGGSLLSGNGSVGSGSEVRTGWRAKSSSCSASGDFEFNTHLLCVSNTDFKGTSSNSSYPKSNLLPVSNLYNTAVSSGTEQYVSFGLVNSSNYSDASPITPVLAESEILYGFRISATNTDITSYPAQAWSSGNNIARIYTSTAENYSNVQQESFNVMSAPLVIEVIESGVVVYTHTLTESLNTTVELNSDNATGNYGYYSDISDLGSLSGSMNGGVQYEHFGYKDSLNDNYCPFTVKRVGTTISYYIRESLIYTSLATSSETLIPGSLTTGTVQGSFSITDQYEFGAQLRYDFKKPQTDYWVKVGTSGSGNGPFNANFLYLQTAYRGAFSIKIDGVEATMVGFNESGTLGAGEVSVFPQEGLIRCSASDAGKTVTVAIPCAYR